MQKTLEHTEKHSEIKVISLLKDNHLWFWHMPF